MIDACEKCGDSDIVKRYIEPKPVYAGSCFVRNTKEYMAYRCQSCGYVWRGPTLKSREAAREACRKAMSLYEDDPLAVAVWNAEATETERWLGETADRVILFSERNRIAAQADRIIAENHIEKSTEGVVAALSIIGALKRPCDTRKSGGCWVCDQCGQQESRELEAMCWKCGKGEMRFVEGR